MKYHNFKRDCSYGRIPPERVWREKIAPFYEANHTLRETARAFRMDMKTLRRELPKYTKIRSPGVRPGFKRKPYGHYPKEDTPNEPDSSLVEPQEEIEQKPIDIPLPPEKPKRRVIQVDE